MNFVNTDGVKKVISGIKTWIAKKMIEWWGTLQISHVDGDKDQWEFSSDIVDGKPKLWLRTTDWKYSKWIETTANNWFPFTCAPAQPQNLKDGGKYQSYYFNSINVNPSNGKLRLQGTTTAMGFKVPGGTDTQVILGDGSTKEISSLNFENNIPTINSMIRTEIARSSNNPIVFPITDETYSKFENMNFFQAMDENMVFKRINDTNNGYPMFVADCISTLDLPEQIVAYIVDEVGIFGDNYLYNICFAIYTEGLDIDNFPGDGSTYDTELEIDDITIG